MDTDIDYNDSYMQIALDSAMKGLALGELPVGASLSIDGKLVGSAWNKNRSSEDFNHHAEKTLVDSFSRELFLALREGKQTAIYTTWEPCLMCLGSSALNRVNKIFYACPDPRGGTAHLNPELIGPGYLKMWPKIIPVQGEYAEKSCDLLISYMESSDGWKTLLDELKKLKLSFDNAPTRN